MVLFKINLKIKWSLNLNLWQAISFHSLGEYFNIIFLVFYLLPKSTEIVASSSPCFYYKLGKGFAKMLILKSFTRVKSTIDLLPCNLTFGMNCSRMKNWPIWNNLHNKFDTVQNGEAITNKKFLELFSARRIGPSGKLLR